MSNQQRTSDQIPLDHDVLNLLCGIHDRRQFDTLRPSPSIPLPGGEGNGALLPPGEGYRAATPPQLLYNNLNSSSNYQYTRVGMRE